MIHKFKAALLVATGIALSVIPANGEGIPVVDKTALLRWASQLDAMKKQFEALNKQISQAEQLYGSLNGLTNMADVASLLNKPDIRKALPPDFATIESLFDGNGSGALGDAASGFLDNNSTYQTSAKDFYARELSRVQKRNAGQMSLGQQIYNTASKRIDGIDQLRMQISSASSAKDVADLQARIQAESAFVQTDLLRMQGLQMVQQAQTQVEQQRQAEAWRKRVDTMNTALGK